jgi:branched-chain amino acid transport system substrate-binding protein
VRHARARRRHRARASGAGRRHWYFLTANYAFGYALEEDTAKYVRSKGGKVLGTVRHPLSAADVSSFLVQAQGSKVMVIRLASASLDTLNSIKQAAESCIVQGAQRLAALRFTLAEVHGLGLKAAQGIVLTEGYYWDVEGQSRGFAKRFMARTGRTPNMIQAGTYSSILQYLKAVQVASMDETEAVAKNIKGMPVDDFCARKGKVQDNCRMVDKMYLLQVKKPQEPKVPWSHYNYRAKQPGIRDRGGERLRSEPRFYPAKRPPGIRAPWPPSRWTTFILRLDGLGVKGRET